jgi:uracil-DNA glycosylase family 4
MTTELQFAQLAAEITACERCPRLRDWCAQVAAVKRRAYLDETYWGRPVPGFGDPAAHLLIVGLAPGAHGANRTGRVFTGDGSGDFLYGALHRAGFASQATSRAREDGMILTDAFITSVCRCAPPANRPRPDEIAACLPFLARETTLLDDLRVIVALGQIAFDATLRLFEPVAGRAVFAHGSVGEIRPRRSLDKEIESPAEGGRLWLIASYHPSRQNTQTGRLTEIMFDRIWATARDLL